MKSYEELKPWSLLFAFNGLYEFIHPQTNNNLLITWGKTINQEVLKFSMIGPQDFLIQLLV
jgi:hypothetical protein